METTKIIQQAKGMAQRYTAGGKREMRLPVFEFDDFLDVYGMAADGAGLTQYRDHCRRTWYLLHFMRAVGADPVPIQVTAQRFEEWVREHGQSLETGHDRAHAVGDFINDPSSRPSNCEHSSEVADLATGVGLATITMFGEDPEQPEVVSVALHLRDGQVVDSLEVLTSENTPDEAWKSINGFLERYQPQRVFQDQTVRRPEFCPDCGALLCSVASPEELQ